MGHPRRSCLGRDCGVPLRATAPKPPPVLYRFVWFYSPVTGLLIPVNACFAQR